jgi:hypothetical protein
MSVTGTEAPNRVKYYQDRADETRAIAEQMSDPTAKGSLLHQSSIWQRMADRADARNSRSRDME